MVNHPSQGAKEAHPWDGIPGGVQSSLHKLLEWAGKEEKRELLRAGPHRYMKQNMKRLW